MNNEIKNEISAEAVNETENGENVLAGIAGAFLFGLAGGLVWFIFYLIGMLSAWSGVVGVICAIKGYTVFSKKESVKGIIISTVVALLVLAIAWYFCMAFDVYKAFQTEFEEGYIDYTLTFHESLRLTPTVISELGLFGEYLRDLGVGLLLGLIGAGGYVYAKFRRK